MAGGERSGPLRIEVGMIEIEKTSISAVMKMPGLTAGGKLVYSAAMAEPRKSLMSLSKDLGKSRVSIAKYCGELTDCGLACLERTRNGFVILPRIPVSAERDLAGELVRRIDSAGYIGEAQSFGWMDTLVWDTDYMDCFRPGYIRNPRTGRPLEFDRIYPKRRVASEFQGSQHYRTTEKYHKEDELADTRLRDLVKLGLSVEKGITIITLEPKDLSLKGMLAKIGDLLPVRPYNANGPLITTLERLGRKYNASIARKEKEAEMASQRAWR